MTDRAALLMDLAERCEKAQGPDRELDAEILAALVGGVAKQSPINGAWCVYIGTDSRGRPRLWEARTDVENAWRHAPFTASLDAALSLVPEGWAWAVYGGAREEIVSTAYCVPNGGRLPWPDWVTDICAATPALALCAAALRALASGAPR